VRRLAQAELKERTQFYYLCTEPCLPWIFCTLGVIFTVFVAIQLYHGDTEMTWTTMAPFLAMAGWITCILSCTCYTFYIQRPWPFHDRAFQDDQGIFKEFVKGLAGPHRRVRNHKSLCFLMSLLLLWTILLSCKLTNTLDWPWWGIFMPWWVAFAYLIFFPCIFQFNQYNENERYKMCAAAWVCIISRPD
jgi:hypothetical protein